jgi:hypothetical protein
LRKASSWPDSQPLKRPTAIDNKPDVSDREMKIIPLFVLCCSLCLLFLTAGCLAPLVVGAAVGAGAGVAGYAYVNGELKSTESAPLDRAWTGTLAAMKDLEFPIVSQQKNAVQADLTVRNASDKKTTIQLKKVTEGATEIRIRVGTFGDESLSRVILEKIKKRL